MATISAHNDATIGELVGDAIEQVGRRRVITVEEAKGPRRPRGRRGHAVRSRLPIALLRHRPREDGVRARGALILLHDKRIGVMKDLLPLLEQVAKEGRPALRRRGHRGRALATLVVNKLRGMFACAAVKAPGYGDRRKAMLEDIAILTGGQVIAEELGREARARRPRGARPRRAASWSRGTTTTIIGGGGTSAAIAGRVEELRDEVRETKSDYDREKLQERSRSSSAASPSSASVLRRRPS